MLLRHHEMTQVRLKFIKYFLSFFNKIFSRQELETKQQRAVHGVREGQLTTQHRTELNNQVITRSQRYSQASLSLVDNTVL